MARHGSDLSHDLRDGDAERGEAVQDGNTNLELRDLTVKVPRQEALAQQFHTMHLGLDAAPAVIAAPLSPEGERGSPTVSRSVQQSLNYVETIPQQDAAEEL